MAHHTPPSPPRRHCIWHTTRPPPLSAGIAFGEIGRKLGELWKALPSEERVPFDQQAAKDKERYTKAMAAFKAGAQPAPEEEVEEEGSGDAGGDDD